ncbi:hypothetical protein AB4Z48_16710 [Cupriavidus sp. 2TAF22]|uniref:hypothetical protein n=1 Tax=unclassified Cupriavidus TaxID=2640874 RepID=UPI003F8DC0C5
MGKLFEALPADERADFEAACRKHGRTREEFTVVLDEEAPPRDAVGPIPRKVAVQANLTGARQSYPAASGTSWTAEFERDLARGFFWETYD